MIDCIAINAYIDGMNAITIRKLSDECKQQLRLRAAENGHSMEQEARDILNRELCSTGNPNERHKNPFLALREMLERDECFADLELPSRKSHRRPPDFT